MKVYKYIKNLLNDTATPNLAVINTFAIFSCIDFIFFYFSGNYLLHEKLENEIRLIGFILSFLLSINHYWPESFKKYLIWDWYFTICFCLPFFGTHMLLLSKDSISWQSNIIIGIFWLGLITDSISFILLMLVGISFGLLFHIFVNETINVSIQPEMITHYIFSALLVFLFTRNKELFLSSKYIAKLQKMQVVITNQSKELSKALAVKTEFLNNISHEIRTPIAAFSMAADNLAKGWEKLSEVQRYSMVHLIAHAAQRIKNLAMHLIDATKFQDSVNSLSLEKTNLTQLIKDFIDEANALYLKDKNIKIKFAPKCDYFVNGDDGALGQVIRNIVLNAIKFSPKKSTITINLKQDKKQVCTTISDEGVGIPDNELDQIFKPFYQSSRTKTGAGGVGLGLNIAKQIINAHKGEIWAENNKIKGASFIFTLPLQSSKNSHNSNHKHGKILVIDDEETLIKIIEMGLSVHSAVEVISALSGSDGLALLETVSGSIDAVVLDIMMPGMDGIEVLKIIKQKWPHLKVIMHSGVATDDEKEESLQLGADAFLAKPYAIDKLVELL